MNPLESKKPAKVLIVDDDAAVRRALLRQMQVLGYQVIEAGDGLQGLAMLKLHQPDFVLLDLHMPRMDGHSFLKEMATAKSTAEVIVLSGGADVRDRVDVLLAGAVQFLPKPWVSEDLAKALARAKERHERRNPRQGT